MTTIIFNHNSQSSWDIKERAVIEKLKTALSFCKNKATGFEVEIRQINKKRSGQQLKAYWVLIKSVKDWMNDKGNNFTAENVSDWFKLQSGHCVEVKGQELPKSIADKSDCTKEEMERLINTILKYGAENSIQDCEIEDRDLENLLNYYKE